MDLGAGIATAAPFACSWSGSVVRLISPVVLSWAVTVTPYARLIPTAPVLACSPAPSGGSSACVAIRSATPGCQGKM